MIQNVEPTLNKVQVLIISSVTVQIEYICNELKQVAGQVNIVVGSEISSIVPHILVQTPSQIITWINNEQMDSAHIVRLLIDDFSVSEADQERILYLQK